MKKLLPVLLLACVVFLVLTPLLQKGFPVTDDGNWMIIRLSAFYQSFAEGQFPVRFLGRLNQSYGYPVANFLYPGFLYAGSVIHYAGFTFVDTVKVLIVLSVSGCAIISFLWLRVYFGLWASSIGTAALVASPYMLFDIYRRGSVGELFAMPWIALALYSIASGKKQLFPLAIFLLIIGHNTLALLFLLFFVVYLFATGRKNEYVIPMLIGIGMGAFFWFPALYDQRYIRFGEIRISSPEDYFLTIQSFWQIGFPPVAAIFGIIRLKKRYSLQNMFLYTFIGAVLLATPLSTILWNIEIIGRLFQFPFRVLAVSIFAGAWIVGGAVNRKSSSVWMISLVVIGLALQLWLSLRFVQREYHPEGYFTTNEATTTVANEYMPKWVSEIPVFRAGSRVEFHQGSGNFNPDLISTQYIKGTIEVNDDSVIQINTLYYPGWGVTLDGILTDINFANPIGVMRVEVPKGTHTLIASFRETVPRFLADIVTLVSGLLFIFYLYKVKEKI